MNIYITDITKTSADRLSGLVSNARIEKSLRYRCEADRLRSLAAGALLNYAVRELFPGQEIPVRPVTDEYQKPHLDFTQFSLSHSGRYAACAIDTNPVGIDVEHLRSHHAAIAKRFFTPAEAEACKDADSFTVCWTLKESFLKAVGYGIRLPMNSFEIRPLSFSVGPEEPVRYSYTHSVDSYNYSGVTYKISDQDYLSVCSRDHRNFPKKPEWIELQA